MAVVMTSAECQSTVGICLVTRLLLVTCRPAGTRLRLIWHLAGVLGAPVLNVGMMGSPGQAQYVLVQLPFV